jgi:hypothetical protein
MRKAFAWSGNFSSVDASGDWRVLAGRAGEQARLRGGLALGSAYDMNKTGFYLWDDPREKSLRDAVYRCLA